MTEPGETLHIPWNDIPEDGAYSFSFEARGWPVDGVVVRRNGVLRAWINRCAHLPLTLDMGTGDFFTQERTEIQCGHHGARYDLDTGLCLWGPCKGRSLEPIPMDTNDPEALVLDLSRVDEDRPPPPADYTETS